MCIMLILCWWCMNLSNRYFWLHELHSQLLLFGADCMESCPNSLLVICRAESFETGLFIGAVNPCHYDVATLLIEGSFCNIGMKG